MVFVWNIDVDPVGSLLWAITLIGLSGLPGLLLKRPGPGQILSVGITVCAALWGMAGALRILNGVPAKTYQLDWPLPFGPCELSVDPLSALFLLPLLLAALCCSLYGLAYLPAASQPAVEKRVTLFSGLLLASMALVLVARHGVLLLMAWEIMALSSWLLLMTDQQSLQVQRAGTVYLLATHAGTTALFVLFSLLKGETGSFAFPAAHSLALGSMVTLVMLVAALIGFGAKAGIMPLHIWLPGAHANAPSHASALMSGIMLKVGIYGIIRTVSFFQQLPVWFGWLVLLLGAVSAITGIALASAQRDLKRLLACSSIENIGIICIGLGMALVGLQSGNRVLAVLGLSGAFIHIINHALFKPLLFLGSGAIIHATGTRQIDRMGGLSRILPRTAPLFLVGSLAICGLPPLNGFVGELFLYFGAFSDGMFSDGMFSDLPLIGFVAPILALVGGLAVITFVKLYGAVFLGVARDPATAHGHEAPLAMLLPMGLLAGLCLIGGFGAPLLLQLVAPAVIQYVGVSPQLFAQIADAVPLQQISLVNGLLVAGMLVVWLIWRFLVQRAPVAASSTWGCGYLAPTSRMQYTGSAFSELVTGLISGLVGAQGQLSGLSGAFPASSRFVTVTTERILDQMIIPSLRGADWCLAWLRRMQHGHLHLYILYIFATLFVLMVWSQP
ncbi:MAG: proton-conducting transporter membrane subunit [Trichlorobacter sp.]|uniref:proton-conducting transporter transmembrane domain-containing protein n=1 Tax=Trichlorobacter sp. TaxID=2911007 RepID=UPI0025655AD9|nr:proton-conducting transporter membrane subunit [Trichlorobacter sp.]MDK9718407.1 proton-conducting transporter membrane subunit [Trichlorobacter sp.]